MKKNVIKFPTNIENDDTIVLDFEGLDSNSVDKVFDVMNFLSNKEELASKFTPDVNRFLENEGYFSDTSFKKEYRDAFKDFVLSLIKDEIVDHFDYTPEEILVLTDMDFIDLLTDGYYFDMEVYKGEKDVNKNKIH